MKLLAFPKNSPIRTLESDSGEIIYTFYRNERIAQGWEEFQWTSLSQTQQLVWKRLAERLEAL
jgi:hypothetical protein